MTVRANDSPDDGALDRIDEILARARDGAEVAADLAALPPELRADAEELLRGMTRGTATSTAGMVIDNYRLLTELGRGGQATVWLAEDLRMRRRVAVKLFRAEFGLSAQGLERIKREAMAASRLHHPGICPVHDIGVANGQQFLVMAWLPGVTLARRIAEWRARVGDHEATALRDERTRAAVTIIELAARALHAAHEAHVVHRDVKPGNLMLTANDQPVILDFGLAQLDDPEIATLTHSGDVFGTPAYMSPEQVEPRGRVDARTDVWSLGVTLYEAIALRRPFDAPTRHLVADAILRREPPRLSSITRCSRDLDVVLATALEKDRDRRYANAGAFADDLRAVLDGRPVAARPLGPVARALRWCRRRPVHAALLVVGLVALLSIVGLSGYLVAYRTELQRGVAAVQRERVERLLDVGYFQRSQGYLSRALGAFEAALREVPDLYEAVLGIWLTHASAGERAAAEAVLDRHRSLLPPDLHGGLRRFFDERRPLDVGNSADPRALFAAGIVDLALGRGDWTLQPLSRAVANFSNCLLASPGSRRLVLFLRAEAAAFAFDFDSCRQSVDFIDRNWPGFAEASYWGGVAMLDVDPARAEASFRRVLQIDANLIAAKRQLARLCARSGDHKQAITLIDAAIAQAPNDAANHWFAAEIYEILRQPAALEAAARRTLELAPRHEVAAVLLTTSLLKRDEIDEALTVLRRMTADAPHPALWVNYGSALQSTGDIDGAVRCWEKAVAMRTRNPQFESVARCSLGLVAVERGRYAEGFAQVEHALELQTKSKRRWLPPMDAVFVGKDELLARERAWEAWLADKEVPDDPAGCVEIGVLRGAYAAALQLAEQQPMATDRAQPVRVWAALAAVAQSVGAADAAALRERARAWLHAELAATSSAGAGTAPAPAEWLELPELAAVRDEAALAALPEAERAAWRALWTEVRGR